MKSIIKITYLFLFSFCAITSAAQTSYVASTITAAQVQPTIMVIPFVKEHENIRDILESNVNKRVAITKVKEGFDNRGVNIIDFLAKVKQLQTDRAFEMENRTSIKQQIVEMSGADIYIETEVSVNYSERGNSVTIILTGYDSFSGHSLANKVCSSPRFYTDDINKLTEKAVEACIEELLDTMNEKFGDMIENGRSLSLNITFSEGSAFDMDSEVGDDNQLLSDAIEDWLTENAYKNYFHTQGVTATKLIVDDVRVPLRDERGNSYRTSKFAAAFRNHLKSLGLDSSRDIQGTRIFITIY